MTKKTLSESLIDLNKGCAGCGVATGGCGCLLFFLGLAILLIFAAALAAA